MASYSHLTFTTEKLIAKDKRKKLTLITAAAAVFVGLIEGHYYFGF